MASPSWLASVMRPRQKFSGWPSGSNEMQDTGTDRGARRCFRLSIGGAFWSSAGKPDLGDETASPHPGLPRLQAGGTAMKILPHFVHLTFEPAGFNRISCKLNRVEQFLHSMIIATTPLRLGCIRCAVCRL
jgi:hypothetical protein